MIAVQIGSNKGYDDFTEIVSTSQVDKIILVEPFHEHNLSLNNCYKDYENVIIENIIVTDDPSKTTDVIFYHNEDSKHSNMFELASLNRLHSLKVRSQYDESGIIGRSVNCMTLNKLLEKHNITDLDLLFVDTEGFDDKIIYSIDFDQFKINEIYYKNLHIDSEQLKIFLENKNYKITKFVGYGGWTDMAKLNE